MTECAVTMTLLGCAAAFISPAAAQTSSGAGKGSAFLAQADVNSDGLLSLDEFILFQGEGEMQRRDRNKDNILSKAEWIGEGAADSFYQISFDKFNANGDDIFSADEIVDVFTWAFGNRDSNKDGFLSPAEAPKTLLRGN
ncbi:hypothetical protein LPB140_03505 [Sphingorhabdus lutea]|uniref:EF-hand domain-containing protein n=2 Tax=Sphingorhabdus lutea TaxID=1913578 RepID=A0A1L3JA73_9SPHN|nr:hypothetical protein LPB140_03505 [Sphingorhabdus lutea]